MSIAKDVREALAESDQVAGFELQGALRDAEELAERFSDVKPVPYVVPIERFVGLPIIGESKGHV
jgi:hypothetical protein